MSEKHKTIFERIRESDHEMLVEDLEADAAASGEALVADDAAEDATETTIIGVDPETLVVEQSQDDNFVPDSVDPVEDTDDADD